MAKRRTSADVPIRQEDQIIDVSEKLTSSFSLSSLASRSFLNRSLISRSLTTQAAASPAAASGRDLFFSRSTVAKRVSSLSYFDRTHQRRGSQMYARAHVRGRRNTAHTETRQQKKTISERQTGTHSPAARPR